MIEGQLNIYDMINEKYKITKPIRLIEFFAGYGSQALALKYLGVPFEHWKICEWAVKSIQAYKDIHFTNDNTNYFSKQQFDDSWLISWLFEKGISSNYNEPMTKQQIMRLSETQRKTIYNNICVTHNLVNIQQVNGKDLEIVDTDKYDYILTYSFPCQDLSLAGKGFDVIFRNGYSSNSPSIKCRISLYKGLSGKKEWGAEPRKLYYVLKILSVEEVN